MLTNLSKEINDELNEEQSKQDFYDLLHEDHLFNDFIDKHFLNLNESGVKNTMLKNEMPFLFAEDTVVDDELVSNLQNEVDYEDNFNKKPIEDTNDTTNLQEPSDYDDNFSTSYASDAEPSTNLNQEVDYSDNQTTPVNIDEFSNEATDFLISMGDYSSLLEDMNEETIEQAEEGSAKDVEDPVLSDLDGVVMEGNEPSAPADDAEGLDEDFDQLVEDFLGGLSESDDEDEDEDDDKDDDDKCPECGKDPCECDDDKKEKEDDDDEELDECGSSCDDDTCKESFGIDSWFN